MNYDKIIDEHYEKYDNPDLNLPINILTEHPSLTFPDEEIGKKALISKLFYN